MNSRHNLREFDYLQDVYKKTCEAFERGDLSASEARETILGVRHTDQAGVVWKIDVTRSGRRASFIQADQKVQPRANTFERPTAFGLDGMNQKYQAICDAFDRREITPAAAREQVLALRFTDESGRTWKIDRQRSGRNAAFIADHAVAPPEPPPSHELSLDTEHVPVTHIDRVHIGDEKSRFRLLELVAAVLLLGGIALVFRSATDDNSASSTNPTSAAVVDSNSNSSDANGSDLASFDIQSTLSTQVVPKLSSFGGRSSVPNDTEVEFGRSVLNRPLTVIRRGNPNGVRVVVVGCIHGTEFAGLEVTNLLKTAALPDSIDLWILPMLNPDGYAQGTRQNANKVDLNRNFPINWKPVGKIGYWQWSGVAPASEPEVKAMLELGNVIQPQLTIWYHQDYFRISPGTGRDGAIRNRYARLVDLPLLRIKGGSYSGTAAMWSETMNKSNTTSLTVEFGKGLRDGEAQSNAAAVTKVVGEFFPSSKN